MIHIENSEAIWPAIAKRLCPTSIKQEEHAASASYEAQRSQNTKERPKHGIFLHSLHASMRSHLNEQAH